MGGGGDHQRTAAQMTLGANLSAGVMYVDRCRPVTSGVILSSPLWCPLPGAELQLPPPPPVDEIPSLISCCCASFVCFLFPVFFPRRPAFVRDTLQEKHRVTVSSDCQPPRTAHPLEVAHIVLVQCHRGE